MNKVTLTVSALFLSAFLVSCGAISGSNGSNSKKPLAGDAKVILEIFAGYSCSSCNEELP